MIKNLQKKMPLGLRRMVLVGLVGTLFVATTALAEDTNATTMKPVVVTGSYIPTAETVGPAPVETVTAAQIERTGEEDVRLILKKLSPSFSGNNNIGPEVNNGGAGESYASIRNLKTLVLINGRRLGDRTSRRDARSSRPVRATPPKPLYESNSIFSSPLIPENILKPPSLLHPRASPAAAALRPIRRGWDQPPSKVKTAPHTPIGHF